MFDPNKPLLTLSDKAADHVRALVEKGGDGVIGIRVSEDSRMFRHEISG